MKISVILVTHGRPNLLLRALASYEVARSSAEKSGPFDFDLRILVNGHDDKTVELLSGKHHFQQVDFPVTPAAARNFLLKDVHSPWVFFMDDDIELPKSFFKNFYQLAFDHPDVEIWGGPNMTPMLNNYLQLRNGWILACSLITGPVSSRYALSGRKTCDGNQFNLMLCNLFIKSYRLSDATFLPIFKTAEENELLYRLQEKKISACASDWLSVTHERRQNASSFLKQIFYYGFGRGQLFCTVSLAKQIHLLFFPHF